MENLNLPNLLGDLILSLVILYLMRGEVQFRDGLIAKRDSKIEELEDRYEASQREYIEALKKLKGLNVDDTQSRRPSRTVQPNLSEDERATAVRKMNE